MRPAAADEVSGAEGRGRGTAEAPRPARVEGARTSTTPTTGRPTRSRWRARCRQLGAEPSPGRAISAIATRPSTRNTCGIAIAIASACAPVLSPRSMTRCVRSCRSRRPKAAIRVRSNQTLDWLQYRGQLAQGAVFRSGVRRVAAACRLEVHRRQDEVSVGAARPERLLRWRRQSGRPRGQLRRTGMSSQHVLQHSLGASTNRDRHSGVWNADSTMAGGQLGWNRPMGSAGRLTLAASYFDLNSVQNRNVFYVNAAGATATAGNTTKTTGCFGGGHRVPDQRLQPDRSVR